MGIVRQEEVKTEATVGEVLARQGLEEADLVTVKVTEEAVWVEGDLADHP